MQSIYLAGGCFWCTEAIYNSLDGIIKVTSGYMGGNIKNPSYEEICSGSTGHAECIECTFDEKKINLRSIFEIFFSTHDPTQLNRQGNDIGTQYRSEVFINNEKQKKIFSEVKDRVQKKLTEQIVTKISMKKEFYPAEGYHQNYYENNTNNFYCKLVIKPKLEILKKNYKNFIYLK